MMAKCGIPKIGGRLLEGSANGFSGLDLCSALREAPLGMETAKGYLASTYRSLGFDNRPRQEVKTYMTRPSGRAVGMCILAGLMQRKDIKLPTSRFTFTMEPDPNSTIRYYDTFDRGSKPHAWPSRPFVDMLVPNGPPTNPAIELSRGMRTYMTAVLLGMSSTRLADEKVAASTTDQAKYICTLSGFKNILQLSAYCAVNGFVTIPEEILGPDPKYVPPIEYSNPVTLEFPTAS